MHRGMKQYFILFLAAALTLASCRGRGAAPSGWTDTIAVETLVVDDGATPTERNYVGDIGSEQEVTLSFPLGGTLTRVAVKNGERVAKGQLLASVDATTATSLHATALATLRQAEDAHRRLEAVHKEGGLSEVKWIEMETNLEKARQTEVSSRKHMDDCTMKAPFSGVVSCTDRQAGQEMKPGETFARLLDMRRLRIAFSVPEQEISLVNVGDAATAVVPALDNRELTLRVSNKALIANPLGHTYKVYATIVSGDLKGLLPDMVAKVRANLGARGGIVVPSDCVQTMPEGTTVWVVADGKAQRRIIEVGDFIRNGVVVKSGLSSGDTVVTAGQQKLYNGARVRLLNP